MEHENEYLSQLEIKHEFLDLIGKKCREHCGMKRAWDDGLCHASEEMCCLVPHSPILAGRASLARPDAKVDPQDFGDL